MEKRVLFLSYLGGIGGGESFLLNHIRCLKESRYTSMIAIASLGALSERCHAEKIPVFKLDNPEGKAHGRFLSRMRLVVKLARIIRQNRISLLHLNDMELGKYGAIAAKICRIPVVWTCHGWWYSGPLRELFYRFFVDHTVAVSFPVLNSLVRRNILSAKRVSVINPGVDVNKFAPMQASKDLSKDLGLSLNQVVVAIVGRFQPIKGHITFLNAAREVAQKVPEAVFLVVGGNVFDVSEDHYHQAEIYNMVSSDPMLQKRVKFVDFQNDMPKLFSLVDILVSASEAESFGMVHLEAMSCGCSVISTNEGGPAEIIQHGETGYLVPPGDYSILSEKIIFLCQNSELRNRFGKAARKRAEENFAIEQQTNKYVERVYESLGV